MLHGYFDDSGTHSTSKVAVWGGVFGKAEAFALFSEKWTNLLKRPIDGKASLRKMHLTDLCSGKGEFFGYSQGARDLTRRAFRDLIVESGLVCIAYIVMVDDWLKASSERERMFLGDAKNFAFQGALEAVVALTNLQNDDILLFLDKGAEDVGVRTLLAVWKEARKAASDRTDVKYAAVEDVPGLQAADIVAYEAYLYGLHLLDPEKFPENPHFIDLRNRCNVVFLSLHEQEMRAHPVKWRNGMHEYFGIDP